MITVITTFQLPKPITREEARRTFLSTAPKYQGVAGLFRKYYFLSQDRKTVGGIYLWNSRAEAETMYTESWRAFVRDKMQILRLPTLTAQSWLTTFRTKFFRTTRATNEANGLIDPWRARDGQ